MNTSLFHHQLFEEVRFADRLIKDFIADICAKRNLTPFTCYILGSLSSNDGQSIKALASKCSIYPSNFTPLCKTLEEEGYIKRKQDENDKRSYRLFLTEKGTQTATLIDDEFEAIFQSKDVNTEQLKKQILEGFKALRTLIETKQH